jgi:hypothetical protein
MFKLKKVVEATTDLKESKIQSDLMIKDFPPITKHDNPEVIASYVWSHYEKTNEIINHSSIPEMPGGDVLKIATIPRKRKVNQEKSEAEGVRASEPKPKKQKKLKAATTGSEIALSTLQEEVQDLGEIEILDTRTRRGKQAQSSEVPVLKPEHKRRRTVRKLKESQYVLQEAAEIEAQNELVRSDVKIATSIRVPMKEAVQEKVRTDAEKVLLLTNEVQDLSAQETGKLLKTSMEAKRETLDSSEVGPSKATSEAARGKSQTHSNSDSLANFSSLSSSSTESDDQPISRHLRKPRTTSTSSSFKPVNVIEIEDGPVPILERV